jgi:membrane protease YdiL (CAAX protease family)
MSDAFIYLGGLGVAGYFFWLWLEDYRANTGRLLARAADHSKDTPGPTAAIALGLPGAMPASWFATTIAVLGALVILAAEVAGEYGLEVVEDQTTMSVLFGIYTLAAAFVEELVFRGFLFFDRYGKWVLYGSIVLISILFALIHPYIWSYDVPENQPPWLFWKWLGLNIWQQNGQLKIQPLFSTSILLVNSLWFYYVRMFPPNRYRSLIPCVAAHMASNLGVFLVKACQGKVELFS